MKRASFLAGASLSLLLLIGFADVPSSYANEGTQETIASEATSADVDEKDSFPNPDYQGKGNLKEYWDSVQELRTVIYKAGPVFEGMNLTEEQLAQTRALIDPAQQETDLEKLEETKAALLAMAQTWEEEAAAAKAAAAAEAARLAAIESGAYEYPSGNGVLTRSGGVNYFNGRRETWYSQRVLPGGGLRIPGRHVAIDGTIRDADNYIVVAASDLPWGTIIETSLGTAKVYDSGCDAGTTDIYTDW